MLRTYLKLALRNLWKNKLYATLNISGLSIGLGCFLVIMLFIQNELSYDGSVNSDRIFRVLSNDNNSSKGSYKSPEVTPLLGPEVVRKIPSVDAFTRFWQDKYGQVKLKSKNDSSAFTPATLVDSGFVEIFDLRFLIGDKSSSFKQRNSALITESEAIKIYGSSQAAINQELKLQDMYFVIDGVIASPSVNSSLSYGVLLPYNEVGDLIDLKSDWDSRFRGQTFFLVNDIASIELLEASIKDIYEANGIKNTNHSLESLKQVHFSLDVEDGVLGKSDYQYVLIFSGAAVLILLCALFNYVSLTLSQSLRRTKEVGVRRIIGSRRGQIFLQFFLESFIYSSVSIVFAVVLAEFLIPELEELFGRKIIGINYSLSFFSTATLFIALLSILGSIYPTILSFRNRTTEMLHGSSNGMFDTNRLVGVVTTFQMMAFVILVCSALIGKQQMEFLQNENLGFDNENVLLIDMSGSKSLVSKIEPLKNQLSQLSGVENISRTSQIPPGTGGVEVNDDLDYNVYSYYIDENFLKTLDIQLISGRSFTESDKAFSLFYDRNKYGNDFIQDVLVSETAVKKLGLPDDPIGTIINGSFHKTRVIGVVGDFHYVSKKKVIDPVIFKKSDLTRSWKLAIRLNKGSVKKVMDEIEVAYEETTGEANMTYYFLDDKFNEQYRQEIMMTTMIDAFTLVALIIAVIGLYGLSSYNASRRLKEMGIRKILGANFYEIQKSLNSPFVKRLILAVLIAVPIVFYYAREWLSSFAYQIDLPIDTVALAIILASLFVIMAISVHSVRAYFINPVEILRNE